MDALRPPDLEPAFFMREPDGSQLCYKKYKHERISEPRSIRLIKLQSPPAQSSVDPRIRWNIFSIEQRRLDDPDLDYAALSYSWGEPKFNAPFVVQTAQDRRIIAITRGLWEAMTLVVSVLAKMRPHVYFWADQLCINQEDNEEKASQVKLMGEIYRKSWICPIWLGHSDENTAAAMSLAKRIGDIFPDNSKWVLESAQLKALPHGRIRELLTQTLGKDPLPPQSDPGWPAFAELLQRPWFSRLWTLQEAVLSYKGDAVFMCGRSSATYMSFTRTAELLGHEHTFGVNFGKSRSAVQTISKYRHFVENKKLTPLVWILHENALYDCFDPRDRIYAMLGLRLEDDQNFGDIEIDYQIEPARLYINVARRIIKSQAALCITAGAAERGRDGKVGSLPSWVPDWTATRYTSAFDRFNSDQSFFKASGPHKHRDIEEDPYELLVRGQILDTVSFVVESDMSGLSGELDRKTYLIKELLPALRSHLLIGQMDAVIAKRLHKIAKTLILDGYTQAETLNKHGLQPGDWSEEACDQMMRMMLDMPRSGVDVPISVSSEQWISAIVLDAFQCINRRFALLEKNLFGLMPRATVQGDVIAILHGSSLPVVLRKSGDGYRMVGVCFVDSMMYGEQTTWEADEAAQFKIY